MAAYGLPEIIRRSPSGPGLLFLRFVLGFFVIPFYYYRGP
jgi:hypothetical protein